MNEKIKSRGFQVVIISKMIKKFLCGSTLHVYNDLNVLINVLFWYHTISYEFAYKLLGLVEVVGFQLQVLTQALTHALKYPLTMKLYLQYPSYMDIWLNVFLYPNSLKKNNFLNIVNYHLVSLSRL